MPPAPVDGKSTAVFSGPALQVDFSKFGMGSLILTLNPDGS